MTLPAPTLRDFPTENSDGEIVVSLSKLKDSLEIEIPDSAQIHGENEVCAILGEDEADPDWRGSRRDGPGYRVSAGAFNEETEEFERTLGLKVHASKKNLKPYLNQTVTLRYQAIDASDFMTSSSSLTLCIEP
jgi:hypothetical protein